MIGRRGAPFVHAEVSIDITFTDTDQISRTAVLGDLSVAHPSHTARSAFAVARAAYERLLLTAIGGSDQRTSKVAIRAYARGVEAIQAMEASASDLALSSHATEAFAAHLAALETADSDAAMSWLDLFPEVMRDIRRDATVPVVEVSLDTAATASFSDRLPDEEMSRDGEDQYRSSGNRQSTLALAA